MPYKVRPLTRSQRDMLSILNDGMWELGEWPPIGDSKPVYLWRRYGTGEMLHASRQTVVSLLTRRLIRLRRPSGPTQPPTLILTFEGRRATTWTGVTSPSFRGHPE